MSSLTVLRTRYPRTAANLNRYGGGTARRFEQTGIFARFTRMSLWEIGWALRRYPQRDVAAHRRDRHGYRRDGRRRGHGRDHRFRDAVRWLADRHPGLRVAGQHRCRGIHRILCRPGQHRVAAPIVTGVALAATVGAGATAQLGAMRISEEIDALEVMGIKSISFLVSTRILAGLVVIGPLYALALDMAFTVGSGRHHACSTDSRTALTSTTSAPSCVPRMWFGRSVEVVVMAVVVMITHCYYGYTASGGPVGVGQAVGRSMRFSLVSVVVVVLLASVGALRRRPELQSHGVTAMTTPVTRKTRRVCRSTWRASVLCDLRVGSRIGVRAVSGDFTPKTELTMLASRAGLVMEPGSKVTYNGVAIGRVAGISEVEHRRQAGGASFTLDVDPQYVRPDPGQCLAKIQATTVFGNKYVSLTSPKDPRRSGSTPVT